MGTSSLYDWSTTAANNASITGSSINWAENQAPSTINNSSREVMREVALWRDLLGGAKIATGTNTLALTTGLTLAAYAQGMMFAFENTTQNTGAVTINVDTIGAKDIKKFHDVALASGDLEAAGIYVIAYEATAGNFQLLSPVANAPFSDPLTTRGDVIIRGASATSRLAIGAANTVLKTDGTDPSWGTIGTANIAADAITEAKIGSALHTIWIPAAAMRPTSSNGCAGITDVETTSGRPDMQVLDFDASSDEHAQFGVSFPKSWNEGTVTASFVWCSTATDTDGVSWGIQGVATSDSDTIDVAYGTAIVVDDANISAAEDCYVSATTSAITIAGSPAEGDMCFFRVFRDVSDANDTAAEDARLIGVKVFFTTDTGGDT